MSVDAVQNLDWFNFTLVSYLLTGCLSVSLSLSFSASASVSVLVSVSLSLSLS